MVMSISKTCLNKGLQPRYGKWKNLTAANAAGDDQMNRIRSPFFIGKGLSVQFRSGKFRPGGEPELLQNGENPVCIGTAGGTGNDGGTNGNCLSVGYSKLAAAFYAVSDGVSQIQLHTGTGVKFVLHDHIPLQFHAPGNDMLPVKADSGCFQLCEQIGVIQNAVFDDLRAAVPEDILRKVSSYFTPQLWQVRVMPLPSVFPSAPQ